MCTSSARDNAWGASSAAGGESTPVPTISANIVKANPEQWVLVDVREVDEDRSNAPEGAINMTVGKICSEANHQNLPSEWADKKIALMCNVGYRSGVACRELQTYGYKNAYSVQQGAKAFADPMLMDPDHATLIATNDLEKVTLALTGSMVQQKKGKQAVVILMGEGVTIVKKEGDSTKVDTMVAPEPFKPCKVLVSNFLKMGGVIAACTTCVKSRSWDFSDLSDYTQKLQMPDALRYMETAPLSMQFM